MNYLKKSLIERINDIEVQDLQYTELDLCFYELVSVGFLLYGGDRSHAQFILQKLIILSQYVPHGKGLKNNQQLSTDILRSYAKSNPQTWRFHIVEALAIIRAKRVLRKLGLSWLEIYQHFLPQVPQISVNIHPLLKALYIIAERLTPDKAGQLIQYVNTKCDSGDLRFYDFSHLEIFLLHWLTKSIIRIGDKKLEDCNVDILIEYLKLKNVEDMKDILLETIQQNAKVQETTTCEMFTNFKSNYKNGSGVSLANEIFNGCSDKITTEVDVNIQHEDESENSERYVISRNNAGYVLIINQSEFYKETDPQLQHLIPSMHDNVPKRKGTDVDRDKLRDLFTSVGYTALIFENLTHLEILHQIRETVKKSLLKDSLIICILSHGMEGVVLGCNTIPIAIAEIKDILASDTLKGKPKMLIVQACQRNVAPIDTKSSTTMTDFSVDAYADILLAMSSIPGTDALRHTENGSWFVESFCKFAQKDGNRKHMLDILTDVTRDISERKSDANQVMLPTSSNTLRKQFYLPSRM